MIQAVRGCKDILPDEIMKWHFVEDKFREIAELYRYIELRTPIFEKTEVFNRSIGEATDIVNKEMYTFTDKGGESITLRPEMTASLVRSLIQNKLLGQGIVQRFWYFGPFFRYERPQKGRLRQFHQFGAECLGSENSESDVELIQLADSLFNALGIREYKLLLNSLGNDVSRKNYRMALLEYFSAVRNSLSDDSKQRLETNPLRILDSKDENDIKLVNEAPIILDYLDEISKDHFESVKNSLDNLNIKYIVEPKLVRGLDYYCHTVFEFQSNYLGSQDSFGGGGRYDGLVEQLGGKPTPSVGFALGVERILIILQELNVFSELAVHTDFFIVTLGGEAVRLGQQTASVLRERGFSVVADLHRRSLKAQLREANRMNVKYTIIIGDEEVKTGELVLKNMKDSIQSNISFSELSEYSF